MRFEYTNWQFDIERAPKGTMVTRKVVTKDGTKTYEDHQPDHVILATKCGKVTRSYWIPGEKRWCMLAKDEEPIAWQSWPEHPSKPRQVEAQS